MSVGNQSIHADFHTHSTASDGTLAPAALILESARRGLTHIALTDHDSTAGLAEALQAGQTRGVHVIAGIELSARVERGELHILGYGIDHENDRLQAALESLRHDRRERTGKILQRLRDMGIDIDEDMLPTGEAEGSVGRPHIARAMIDMGVIESVSEGFDRFLARGRPAFVGRALIEPARAIGLIRESGGIAVLAHPFSAPTFREFLPDLIEAGLLGIECYYGEYQREQRFELASLARSAGLIATGGSDYHGPDFREGRDLGSVSIPADAVDTLLDAVGGR